MVVISWILSKTVHFKRKSLVIVVEEEELDVIITNKSDKVLLHHSKQPQWHKDEAMISN